MSTSINWFSPEHTRLIIQFDDHLEWPEFHTAIRQAHRLITPVSNPVDLIILDKAGLPKGNPLSHFREAFKQQPPNLKLVVVVPKQDSSATAAFLKRLANVLAKVFPMKSDVIFVETIEQAHDLLDRRAKPLKEA